MPMMRRFAIFAMLLSAIGCAKSPQVVQTEEPLTVEAWQALPVEVKYTIDTFERLRQSNAKFREQRDWDRFTRTVLLPAKKKDLATKRTGT